MSTAITVEELKKEMQSGARPQMIDVRTASEYATGHIPCTINIPMDQFEARRKDLRLEEGMVLVCKGGTRAKIVAGWMGESAPVRVLTGGTDAWIQEGLEVVSSAKTRWSLERQVRLVAGAVVLLCAGLAVSGVSWTIWVALVIGAGLTFAGITDVCPMGILLAKMPWNQAKGKGVAGNNSCCG